MELSLIEPCHRTVSVPFFLASSLFQCLKQSIAEQPWWDWGMMVRQVKGRLSTPEWVNWINLLEPVIMLPASILLGPPMKCAFALVAVIDFAANVSPSDEAARVIPSNLYPRIQVWVLFTIQHLYCFIFCYCTNIERRQWWWWRDTASASASASAIALLKNCFASTSNLVCVCLCRFFSSRAQLFCVPSIVCCVIKHVK